MVDYTEGSGLQYHIGVNSEMVGEYVILPGDPGRCEKIASFFENAKKVGQNREFTTYTGTLAGHKVSVTSTGIGGPSAAICMEELVRCGVKTFIRVGTCGGMQTNVLGGDLIVASGAVRMEGTSKEYAPIEFPAVADFEVVRALVDAAEAKEYPYHVGVVECKDSFYGQHEPEKKPVSYELENKWKAWMRCGVLASEMESAALYTVASTLKVKCGTILLTVANQERAKLGLPNPQVHDTGKAIEIAVDAIKLLIENDQKK